MIVNSATNFRIDKQRYKREYLSPNSKTLVPSSNFNSQYNNQDIKRPLKINHSDLTFKGLSLGLYRKLDKTYSAKEFLEFSDKYLGKMGRELFKDITEKHAADTSKLISVNGDQITISKKTIPHLAWDGIIYPFKVLPGDLLNGFVELLGKTPGLKNWSTKTLERPFFKKIRQRSKLDSKINSLTGMITYRDIKIENAIEKYAKANNIKAQKLNGKKVYDIPADKKAQIIQDIDAKMESSIFQSELKMFDPKSGNYDTKHERALNRLVSGLPPAIFLANDAYNLSRMMDDDSKAAERERKIRFKQEVSRILTSGYLTLITMGAFQKFINKSKAGIMLTTGITVLVTEMYSRLANGKHITRLTPEQARKENKKLNAPEAKIKPVETKTPITSTGSNQTKTKEQQKPLLSFDTIMKASAAILTLGYGIKGIKNLSAVKKAALKYFENLKINNAPKYEELKIKDLNLDNAVETFEKKVLYRPFTNLYNRLTSETFHVELEKYNKVVDELKKYDPVFAAKYQKIGLEKLKTKDGKSYIDLGKKDKEIRPFAKIKPLEKLSINVKPFVNLIIAPFKFMWNTVTLPYWMIDEKLMNIFRKSKPKNAPKDIEALAKSFDRIARKALKKNLDRKQFQDYLQVNFLKAFNEDSLSSVSNAELSNLAKTAASIATIWFLMTDNYNMVMLKSNGNDRQGADTKFKERFVQEGSRLFYQTLLIDLFNSAFRNQYNSSLLGMSWITLTNTSLGEILTRSSVGTPCKAHTRDELIAIETKQNNSTGFKKKYYNFMQRLTGKRSIKSYEVASKNNTRQQTTIPALTVDKNIIFKQNKIS